MMPAMTKPMLGRNARANLLKMELGDYIRQARLANNMTQSDLAQAVGMEYYTAISAIEVGRNTVPPERYYDFAEALGLDPVEFVQKILELTNPWAHAMLYSARPKQALAKLNEALSERFPRAD